MQRAKYPVKTFVRITQAQSDSLDALITQAKERDGSKVDTSDITRAALDEYIERHLEKKRRPDARQLRLGGVPSTPARKRRVKKGGRK